MASIIPATTSQVVSAPATNAGSTSSTSSSTGVDKDTLAGNFSTFLTLLTTQLKNQNPLDPLDTNQFTQQLVQFSQVEQQMKQNDQLATLIAIEKSAQSTTALAFCGLDSCGGWPDREANQWQGQLELHSAEAGECHRHDQECDRP